jgi:hypothetical protein
VQNPNQQQGTQQINPNQNQGQQPLPAVRRPIPPPPVFNRKLDTSRRKRPSVQPSNVHQ